MIDSTKTVFAPLCLDALSARIAEQAGFEYVYVSGGALGYTHAVSEALLEINELVDVVRHIRARSKVKVIVDGGVGFGDAVHMSRCVQLLERAGGAHAIEIEDQVAPNASAITAHRAPNLMRRYGRKNNRGGVLPAQPHYQIIARTGAVKNESLAAALERCQDTWRLAPI